MVIRRVRGDNYPVQVQIFEGDEPMDITGATAFLTVKKRLQDSDDNALIKVETTSHTDASEGITEFDMTSPVDVDIVGSFFYNIRIVLGGQIVSSFADKIIFDPYVTQRTS